MVRGEEKGRNMKWGSGRGIGGHGSWRTGVVSVGTLAVAAIMLLTPAAAGVSPAKTIVLKAPYKTMVTAEFSSTNTVGCGTDRIVTAPHFALKTGTGGFSDAGTAPACAKLPNGIANRGSATSQVSIVQPIHLLHTHTSVVANWTFSASGSESLTSTACPAGAAGVSYDCFELAQVYLFAQAYLIDTTNGSIYFSSNFWPGFINTSENDTFCTPTCTTAILGGSGGSFSASQGVTFYVNATGLNVTHTYALEVDLYGAAYAEIDASNTKLVGGHAAAALNFATLGNGAKLNSLSFTQ